jgi:hypothetical protein
MEPMDQSTDDGGSVDHAEDGDRGDCGEDEAVEEDVARLW